MYPALQATGYRLLARCSAGEVPIIRSCARSASVPLPSGLPPRFPRRRTRIASWPSTRTFESFWSARDRSEAAAAHQCRRVERRIVRRRARGAWSGGSVRTRVMRRAGRQFGRHRTSDGLEHRYSFVVPELRFIEAVSGPRLSARRRRTRATAAARSASNRRAAEPLDEIGMFRLAGPSRRGGRPRQIDNLGRILDRLKRAYNLDENRIYLSRRVRRRRRARSSWRSRTRRRGPLSSDDRRHDRARDPAAPASMRDLSGKRRNKPLYIVNTGRDRLYPAHSCQPTSSICRSWARARFSECMRTRITRRPGGHDESAPFEEFVHDHQRDPLPIEISWETERIDRFNRAHWLVIDRLGRSTARAAARQQPSGARPGIRFWTAHLSAAMRRRGGVGVVGRVERRAHRSADGDRFVEVNGTAVQSGGIFAEQIQRWKIGGAVAAGRRAPAAAVLEGASSRPRSRCRRRADLSAAQAERPCRSGAQGQCCRGSTEGVGASRCCSRRRCSTSASRCGSWPTGGRLRRPGRAERGNAAEMGRARRRPDDGLWRRGDDRPRKRRNGSYWPLEKDHTLEHRITYPLEQGALEIEYIEDFFGEYQRRKKASEIVGRLENRDHLILMATAPLPDDPWDGRSGVVQGGARNPRDEDDSENEDLVERLRDHVDFNGRKILYTWIGGTRRDWRGQGHFRALTEQQEAWAIEKGFDEILVKTKTASTKCAARSTICTSTSSSTSRTWTTATRRSISARS